jgi:hypothetical protein
MTAVTELDVPTLDYRDEGLTGERFRETLRELRERSWIARADPIGWFVLDQEATAHFLRTKAATFPGRMVLEVQGVDSGPLYERLKGNLLDLDGPRPPIGCARSCASSSPSSSTPWPRAAATSSPRSPSRTRPG